MESENLLPTCGQLERQLAQSLHALYRRKFGHLPKKISCHLFSDRLAIVVEGVTTGIEKILVENSKLDLAKSIRSAIDKTFINNIKQDIEEILKVQIEDIIFDSVLDTEYLGIIIFLQNKPETRLPKSRVSKIGKSTKKT